MLYQTTRERSNFARLCRAIIDLCTEVLRNILQDEIDSNNIKTEVRKHLITAPVRNRLKLTSDQEDKIDQAHNNGYTRFDITLLYRLIRYLCTTIHTPTKGWYSEAKNNCPSATDITVGDDIERIRDMRNKLYGHISDTCILDQDFNDYWTVLEDIMQRMSNKFRKPYDRELEDLKTCPMDEELGNKLIEEIKQQREKDKYIKDILMNVKEEMSSLSEYIENLKTDICLSPEARNNQVNTVQMVEAHIDDATYYPTRAVSDGLEVLQTHDLVLYSGIGGDGKTKAALETMKRMADRETGLTLLHVRDITKWNEIVNAKVKSLVLLDDFVGKSNLDMSALESLEKYVDVIYGCVRAGYVKVIMTCRQHILEQVWTKIQNYKLFNRRIIINLSLDQYAMTSEEKRQIFNLHCHNNNIKICLESGEENIESRCIKDTNVIAKIYTTNVENIVKTCSEIGFPQLCFLFCRERKYTRFGITVFEHPSMIILDEISSMCISSNNSDKLMYCLLVYTLLNNGVLNLDDINYSVLNDILNTVGLKMTSVLNAIFRFFATFHIVTFRDIVNAVELLNNKYLIKRENHYAFKHESVLENVAISFSRDHTDIIITHSNGKFISEFLRPENYEAKNGEIIIKVSADKYLLLIRRVLNDPELFVFYFFHLPFLDDYQFVSVLMSSLDTLNHKTNIYESCGGESGIFTMACRGGKSHFVKQLLKKYGTKCNIVAALQYSVEKGNNIDINILSNVNIYPQDTIAKCVEVALHVGSSWESVKYLLCEIKNPDVFQDVCIKAIYKCERVKDYLPEIVSYISKSHLVILDNVLKEAFTQSIRVYNSDVIEWLLDKRNYDIGATPIFVLSNTENLSNLHICAFIGNRVFYKLVKMGLSVRHRSNTGLSVMQAAMLGYVKNTFQAQFEYDILFQAAVLGVMINPYEAQFESFSCDVSDFIKSKSSILSDLAMKLIENIGFYHGKPDYSTHLIYLLTNPNVDLDDIHMSLDREGNKLSHYSVIHDSISIVTIIEKTTEKHILWSKGFRKITPLELAVYLGRIELVRILSQLYRLQNVIIDMEMLDRLLEEGAQYHSQIFRYYDDLPYILKGFDTMLTQNIFGFKNATFSWHLPVIKFGNETDFSLIKYGIKEFR